MSFIPYALLWVGLVGAAAVCLATARRPGLRIAVILAVMPLSIVLWFLFKPDAVLPALNVAGRMWTISQTAWGLTGIALLLALATLIPSLINNEGDPARESAWSLALTAAVLPLLWAGDERTRLLGLAFFAVVWGLASWAVRPRNVAGSGELDSSDGRVLFAVFPLWASLLLPGWALAWSIIAAAILMNAWPFGKRGIGSWEQPFHIVLRGLPLLAGAAVLVAPITSAASRPAEIIVGTAVGLIGFAVGLARAWQRPSEIAGSLGVALAGLVFVAAIWGGVSALLASTRLAVFAPLLLGFATGLVGRRAGADEQRMSAGERTAGYRLSPATLARAVVYVALASLPLTVGFSVIAPLYESWSSGGGWVLLLVVALLLTFWLAALLVDGRSNGGEAIPSRRDEWLRALVWLPSVVGLISLDLSGLNVGPLTWPAIIIPPAAGLLVARFAPPINAFGDLWREAFAIPTGAARLIGRLREAGRTLADAGSDALAILSGDYGLLWLVGLLLLLLWMA